MKFYLWRLSKDNILDIHIDGNFQTSSSLFRNPVSVTTSKPMTILNISSPGDLRRRFAKFFANISQRHNEYVSLSMLYYLKYVLHEWCVSELHPFVIYFRKFKPISMYDLVTSTMRLELSKLSLNIGRRMNEIKGVWPHRKVPSDWASPGGLGSGPQLRFQLFVTKKHHASGWFTTF